MEHKVLLLNSEEIERYHGAIQFEITPNFLNTKRLEAGTVPVIFDHWANAQDSQVGQALSVEYADDKVYGTIEINNDDINKRIAEKSLGGISGSFKILEYNQNEETDLMTIKSAELLEISLVAVPAVSEARIQLSDNQKPNLNFTNLESILLEKNKTKVKGKNKMELEKLKSEVEQTGVQLSATNSKIDELRAELKADRVAVDKKREEGLANIRTNKAYLKLQDASKDEIAFLATDLKLDSDAFEEKLSVMRQFFDKGVKEIVGDQYEKQLLNCDAFSFWNATRDGGEGKVKELATEYLNQKTTDKEVRRGVGCLPLQLFAMQYLRTLSMRGNEGAMRQVEYLTNSTNVLGTIATMTRGDLFSGALKWMINLPMLGAQVLNIVDDTEFAVGTGSYTVQVATDSATSAAAQAITSTRRKLEFRTHSANSDFSRKVKKQANPTMFNLALMELGTDIMRNVEKLAFNGTGTSGQPRGIVNTTGISTLAAYTDTDTPTYPQSRKVAIDLKNKIYETLRRSMLLSGAYVTSSGAYSWLSNQQDGIELIKYGAGMNGSDMVFGCPLHQYNELAADQIVFGDFSELFVGVFGDMEIIEKDSEKGGGSNLEIVVDTDTIVRQAAGFAKIDRA